MLLHRAGCILLLTALPGLCLSANVIYVAKDGTGNFNNILEAYGSAGAGDSIIVKPGIYTEYDPNGYGIHLGRSGTADYPIVLKSQVKWAAMLDGENDSTHVRIMYIDGDYNVVDGFEMKGGYTDGVAIYGSHNSLMYNNIHHNGSGGDPSSVYGQDGVFSSASTHDNLYVGNYIHHNGRIQWNSGLDHGLYLCGDRELVANNVLTFNSAYGLQIAGYSTVTNMKVYNNVMAWNGRSGIVLWLSLDGVDIQNNVFYENRDYGISSWDGHGGGVNVDYNLFASNHAGRMDFWSGGSDYGYAAGAHNRNGDPLFVEDTLDYRVMAGSPAIDAGVTLPEVAADGDGVSRPQGTAYDMGAYEYGAASSGMPAVPERPGLSLEIGSSIPLRVEYQTPRAGLVTLEIYDILGRRREVLMNAEAGAGKHSVSFDAQGCPSGVYWWRLTYGDRMLVRKWVLVR